MVGRSNRQRDEECIGGTTRMTATETLTSLWAEVYKFQSGEGVNWDLLAVLADAMEEFGQRGHECIRWCYKWKRRPDWSPSSKFPPNWYWYGCSSDDWFNSLPSTIPGRMTRKMTQKYFYSPKEAWEELIRVWEDVS